MIVNRKCSVPCRASVVATNPEYTVEIALRVDRTGKVLTGVGEIQRVVEQILAKSADHVHCGYCFEPVVWE